MAAAGVGDDQAPPELFEIDGESAHHLSAGLVTDLERAAEQRGIVVLDAGGQTHQPGLEVAREMDDGVDRGGGCAERSFGGGDQRNRERGARAQAGAARRGARERDLERRQVEVLGHQPHQRALGRRQQLGAIGGLDARPVLRHTPAAVATLEHHPHLEVDRDVDGARAAMQYAERPDVERASAEIDAAGRRGFDPVDHVR